MPLRRPHGAAVAAVCLALGGTAVLTWAFSVFSEDKSKKPLKKPKDEPNSKEEYGSGQSQLPGNGSAEKNGSVIPAKCDMIPEYFYRLSGDKARPLVIENKAASTEPQAPLEHVTSEDNQPAGHEEVVKEAPAPAFYDKQTVPALSIYTRTNLTEKVQHLDDAYNESLVKTPLADAVKENLVRASISDSIRSQSMSSYDGTSETDTKVTILEEQQIPVEEMRLPDIAETEGMTTSVSCKSLETATRTAPPAKPKRAFEMPMGVDNSIRHMEAPNGEPVTMILEEEAPQTECDSSIRMSQHSYTRTISKPSISDEDKAAGLSEKVNGNDEDLSTADSVVQDRPLPGEVSNHIDGRYDRQPDAITMETAVETSSCPESSAKITPGLMVQRQKSSGQVAGSESASLSRDAGYDTSSYQGMLSIAGKVSEGYFMNLNLSGDSNALDPDLRNVSADSLDENENLSEKDDSHGSQNQISNFYVDISGSKTQRSEYHSPQLLERDLTPDRASSSSKNDSVERSELRIKLGNKRSPKGNQYEGLPLVRDELHSSTPIDELCCSTDSLDMNVSEADGSKNTPMPTNTTCALTSPAQQPLTTADTQQAAITDIEVPQLQDAVEDQVDRPNSMISSMSNSSVEFSRTQQTEAEEVVETSVEETVTMVIKGVLLNPGVEEEDEVMLSMQEAVARGILDLANGLYYNSTTRQKMSVIEAMNNGYIKMGPKKVEKSEERVKSVGRITIKTTRETIPYTVKGVTDVKSGSLVSVEKAQELKLLDVTNGVFRNSCNGNTMLIGDAVDLGLVIIEYDLEATGTMQEHITKTYSVHAVVDQREKTKLPFHQAVCRGIIDPDTGGYINNLTGEVVAAEEAITKGLIKATLADDIESISVDGMGNKVAEKGVEAIRKKLLNPLKVLKSMKNS